MAADKRVGADGHRGGGKELVADLHSGGHEVSLGYDDVVAHEQELVAVYLVADLQSGDGLHLGGVEGLVCHGAGGVGPHEQEGEPAEELHEADGPEGLGCVHEELDEAGLLLGLAGGVLGYVVVFIVELRGPLLDLGHGVDDAEYEYGGAYVEGPDDRRRHYALGSSGLDADPGQQEWEHEADDGAGVAQEALDGVCLGLLALVDHVADKHLEWLHGHVDAGVEEHEGDESHEDGA